MQRQRQRQPPASISCPSCILDRQWQSTSGRAWASRGAGGGRATRGRMGVLTYNSKRCSGVQPSSVCLRAGIRLRSEGGSRFSGVQDCRAELRKKIEELQKAEQKAKPSSTNQNNQNNEDSPNEDDSDDGRVAVCGFASAEAIAASHASDPGGHCGRPQSPRLTAAKGSSPPSGSG
eukprot:COSAG04_NODE_738_length_10699_cov_72.861604_3_plen_176_part_00